MDHDINLTHVASVGAAAIFPGFRRFIGFFGLLGLIAAALVCWVASTTDLIPVVPVAALKNIVPGAAFLFGMFCVALLVGIWLPATIAAAAARRLVRNVTEEVAE